MAAERKGPAGPVLEYTTRALRSAQRNPHRRRCGGCLLVEIACSLMQSPLAQRGRLHGPLLMARARLDTTCHLSSEVEAEPIGGSGAYTPTEGSSYTPPSTPSEESSVVLERSLQGSKSLLRSLRTVGEAGPSPVLRQ
jgi:hypothetical protein